MDEAHVSDIYNLVGLSEPRFFNFYGAEVAEREEGAKYIAQTNGTLRGSYLELSVTVAWFRTAPPRRMTSIRRASALSASRWPGGSSRNEGGEAQFTWLHVDRVDARDGLLGIVLTTIGLMVRQGYQLHYVQLDRLEAHQNGRMLSTL